MVKLSQSASDLTIFIPQVHADLLHVLSQHPGETAEAASVPDVDEAADNAAYTDVDRAANELMRLSLSGKSVSSYRRIPR